MHTFRPQDIHTKSTPRYGGVFIIIPFIFAILIWHIVFPDNRLLLLASLSILILGFGILDDLYDFSAFMQLIFQILLAIAVVAFGAKISYITNPFGGIIFLGTLASFFTILWIISIINVVNWIDGIDGLATSIGLIGSITLCILSLLPKVNQPFSAGLAGILIIILAIFLIFSIPPAKIFLGTSGSVFIGFMLAILAIISGGKLATAFLVLGMPIIDAFWVIITRIQLKKSIFKADQSHMHHRLLKAGISPKKALLILIFPPFVFGCCSVFVQSLGKFILILLLPLTFSAILLYFS